MIAHDYSPLKAALERLTVPDVWLLLGLEGKPGKSCRSPFRTDRHPSFSVYAEGQRWHDYTTGEDGDAADFCAKARGLSQKEGRRLLIDLAGTRRANSAPQGNSGKQKSQFRTIPLQTRTRHTSAKAGQSSRSPRKRRSRQLQHFEACRLKGLHWPTNAACSSLPTHAKAGPGSSPTAVA
jgi:hypothetical protein